MVFVCLLPVSFIGLPTLFLITIILLVVMRDLLDFVKLFTVVLVFGVMLFGLVKAYKRRREKRETKN